MATVSEALAETAALAADNRSGATALTARAGSILAAAADLPPGEWAAVALAVARAQPPMASLLRLANAALLAAEAHPGAPAEAIRHAVSRFLEDLARHAAETARLGAAIAQGRRILTHSASSLVADAIRLAHAMAPVRVVCTESRPALEGVALARSLAREGIPVCLVTDAGAAAVLPECDLVLFGADALCADGVVHKIGTLGLAIAARHFGVPAYVLATDEKLLPAACGARPPIPLRDPGELLPEPAPGVEALNRYFDVTPRFCLGGVVCETGIMSDEHFTRRLSEVPVHPALQGLWQVPG